MMFPNDPARSIAYRDAMKITQVKVLLHGTAAGKPRARLRMAPLLIKLLRSVNPRDAERVAASLGCNPKAASAYRDGGAWSHPALQAGEPCSRVRKWGRKPACSMALARSVHRAYYTRGLSYTDLMRAYGVSYGVARRVVLGAGPYSFLRGEQ